VLLDALRPHLHGAAYSWAVKQIIVFVSAVDSLPCTQKLTVYVCLKLSPFDTLPDQRHRPPSGVIDSGFLTGALFAVLHALPISVAVALGAAVGNVRHSCCRISPEITPDSNLYKRTLVAVWRLHLPATVADIVQLLPARGAFSYQLVFIWTSRADLMPVLLLTLSSLARWMHSLHQPLRSYVGWTFFGFFCWGHRGSAISGCDILRLYELRMPSTTGVLYRVTLFRAPPLAIIGRNVCFQRGGKSVVRSVGDGTLDCWMCVA